MSADQNKAIVQRFIEELWNNRNRDVADEIFAADCVTHQLRSGSAFVSVKRNAEFVKNHVAEWLAGFPNLRFTLERMIAEGDQVVSQMVMKGTHAGTWLGIAPTGKEVSIRRIVIHRIVNGRIAEDWVLVESLELSSNLESYHRPEAADGSSLSVGAR